MKKKTRISQGTAMCIYRYVHNIYIFCTYLYICTYIHILSIYTYIYYAIIRTVQIYIK